MRNIENCPVSAPVPGVATGPASLNPLVTRRALICAGAASLCALATARTPMLGGGHVAHADSSQQGQGFPVLDMSAWNLDEANGVWWQVGVAYCTNPATTDYETLGIYVPQAYMTGTANADGATYTCALNTAGQQGSYSCATAPIVIPVNTAGYSAQPAPTSYSYDSLASYIEAGLVYVYPGCRGRANGYAADGSLEFAGGAPWGVTDLKAAVRFLRANRENVPGDVAEVFTFGHSGGGAQSALMGATGDAEAFRPYLESIGAAMQDADGNDVSDAISGAMCWCPITCLDEADAAYEWMMGQFATESTREEGTWTAALSGDLARSYADYVNQAGFVGEDGAALRLEESDEGVCLAGSYYDLLLSLVNRSLNNFLADTEFPYTPSGQTMADGGFGGGLGGDAPADGAAGGQGGPGDGATPADGGAPTAGATPADGGAGAQGAPADGQAPGDAPSAGMPDGQGGPGDQAGDAAESVTYETASDYIASLNADQKWVAYDESSNTATVCDLGAFVRTCKPATKTVGAFDSPQRSQAENDLFGTAEQDAAHFDATLAGLLSAHANEYAALAGWDASLPQAYADDLALADDEGAGTSQRVATYNPLSYLLDSYSLAGASQVAPHWRIRTGIAQGDTALTCEMNLAAALRADASVEDVDFETVWGQGHTTAERTGSSDENFIAWVGECLA